MIGLLIVCGLAGFCVYAALLGSSERAAEEVKKNPGQGIAGIAAGAVLVLFCLWVIGMLAGG